jgi:hypothetical protein
MSVTHCNATMVLVRGPLVWPWWMATASRLPLIVPMSSDFIDPIHALFRKSTSVSEYTRMYNDTNKYFSQSSSFRLVARREAWRPSSSARPLKSLSFS